MFLWKCSVHVCWVRVRAWKWLDLHVSHEKCTRDGLVSLNVAAASLLMEPKNLSHEKWSTLFVTIFWSNGAALHIHDSLLCAIGNIQICFWYWQSPCRFYISLLCRPGSWCWSLLIILLFFIARKRERERGPDRTCNCTALHFSRLHYNLLILLCVFFIDIACSNWCFRMFSSSVWMDFMWN